MFYLFYLRKRRPKEVVFSAACFPPGPRCTPQKTEKLWFSSTPQCSRHHNTR